MSRPESNGALVGACLRALGAHRVFGSSASGIGGLEGLAHVVVDDPAVATLLADAAGRIGPGPGVAVLPGRVLRISSAPGAPADRVTVTDPADLPVLVASWSLAAVDAAVELVLEVDLDDPPPDGVEPVTLDPSGGRGLVLDPSLRELGLVVLAGPGVVREGQVDALAAFAGAAGCGVVNTWGAKGVFRWDNPHHHGTAGLQARDFELAGITDARIVVAVGLDPMEAPEDRWRGPQVIEVVPRQLGMLAAHWPAPVGAVPPPPALYRELAAALGPLYASAQTPLTPARAAADLAGARPAGALVAADPGPAGLWLARAFATTEPGSVIVPSRRVRGFAAAAAVVSSLDGRAAVGVVTDPVDEATAAVVDQATAWGAALTLEVWGADAPGLGPAERVERLAAALDDRGVHQLSVPVDFSHTRVLVEVAGEVVAWA